MISNFLLLATAIYIYVAQCGLSKASFHQKFCIYVSTVLVISYICLPIAKKSAKSKLGGLQPCDDLTWNDPWYVALSFFTHTITGPIMTGSLPLRLVTSCKWQYVVTTT